MRKLVIKEEGKIWPILLWSDRKFIIYYVGEREEDIIVEETRKMDFENILENLEKGKSVFITMRPVRAQDLEMSQDGPEKISSYR
ncbi:hypothetical protein KEJ49_00075 [Candidatus Bathyarchaeota archaeon]|nr:hypothetical protein [Candidatus Bathyarchaeota archaeon]